MVAPSAANASLAARHAWVNGAVKRPPSRARRPARREGGGVVDLCGRRRIIVGRGAVDASARLAAR
jgi:hypothetical protein